MCGRGTERTGGRASTRGWGGYGPRTTRHRARVRGGRHTDRGGHARRRQRRAGGGGGGESRHAPRDTRRAAVRPRAARVGLAAGDALAGAPGAAGVCDPRAIRAHHATFRDPIPHWTSFTTGGSQPLPDYVTAEELDSEVAFMRDALASGARSETPCHVRSKMDRRRPLGV
jgi:hypothetical protein